jgi:glycosyltransferase involved in cell wall biosynthesis
MKGRNKLPGRRVGMGQLGSPSTVTIFSPLGHPRRGRLEGTGLLVLIETADHAWRYSLDLALGLSRLGHESVLVPTGWAASDEQFRAAAAIPGARLVDSGLAVDASGEDEASLRKTAVAIAALAAEAQADLLQLSSPALAGLALFEMPVVAVQHGCVATWWEAVQGGELPADFAWRTGLIRAGLHAADAVVTPTRAFGTAVQRLYGLAEAPRNVHHGRPPLAAPQGAPRDFVLTAGRLWDEGKNFGLLDAAAGRIGVPVHAAGPLAGPNGAPVMFDNIHCLGPLDEAELGRWLSARPVFVSAALYEPFGLAVLDAASAGCALILADIPAFRELWEEVAIFVDPRDESGFTRAIGDLVGDDFERAVLGRAAKERAARYTPDAMAAQMASLYRSLLPAVRRPVLAATRAAA